ncbi:hypothetical protein Elgi_32110 [Paenibacillus elgii]|uniref:PD-(D/E)XK nuclease family protein n=1 Tax=Paenibacillus elgii TaxID=189691 RepID=UPI002D7B7925|nr:hypothetical protein Elgi_32110 [Paenibacillus elgii]
MQLAAEEEGLDSKWLPDVISTVRRVLESGLWRRSRKAKQVYHEFSFMSMREATPESSLCLLKGAIDLVFEEEDGWVIVDFKTDMFEAKHLDRFVYYYAPQVQAYTEQWTRAFQLPVKETGLYFTFSESYVRV